MGSERKDDVDYLLLAWWDETHGLGNEPWVTWINPQGFVAHSDIHDTREGVGHVESSMTTDRRYIGLFNCTWYPAMIFPDQSTTLSWEPIGNPWRTQVERHEGPGGTFTIIATSEMTDGARVLSVRCEQDWRTGEDW